MYFDKANSAKRNYGNQTKNILETLIQHFIGSNPKIPYGPILDFPSHQPYDSKGWCIVQLEKEFDSLKFGERVLATTYWPAENDRNAKLILECYGPTSVYVNGQQYFTSNPSQENRRRENPIEVSLKKGWNQLSIVTEKTPLGFGFQIRSEMPQWDPTHFYRKTDYFLPTLGFNCKVITEDREFDLNQIAEPEWNVEKEVITSKKEESYLVKIAIPADTKSFIYSGEGNLSFLDDNQIEKNKPTIIARGLDWLDLVYQGVSLSADLENFQWQDTKPVDWLYCGPVIFSKNMPVDFKTIQRSTSGDTIYWQAPLKDGHIRLARNAPLFAHWTYWMGVTLYGFLEASTFFDEKSWKEYALASVSQITEHDVYGQWDRESYNYTMINTQFYWLNELDDCGSFGNLMLECLNYQKSESAITIADRIADFMEKRVLRQADGAFYRCNDTMWIDDLYMSTPFLVRYWELSKDEKYLNDAINQFYFFKERFFMEDKKLMSHIFDTRFKKANRIPWSRGNGWVIFALSELLNKLPEKHSERPKLIEFFNELISGIMAYQDEKGLWHQILDDETTYIESSCTAMFICALSRGIRNGYLQESLIPQGTESLKKAWQGLITYCIDKDGNLYGVCRGSGFSFSREYYRGLGWLLNDAHGIGIVALAGVEYEKLMKFI